ncbi:MAG: tetratricopeptide repeat protein [Planctomycetota bacterium]
MKTNKYRLIIIIFFLAVSAGGVAVSQSNLDKFLLKSEDEILSEVAKLPDKDINLGAVALVLAKGYYPEIDIKKYLFQLDKMAEELKERIGNEDKPQNIVQIINDYLYKTKGFISGYTVTEGKGTEGIYLSSVLDKKEGQCLGLSVLYLALAERLKLPLYAVGLPDHMFVRYDNRTQQINIETSKEGNNLSKNEYLKWLKEWGDEASEKLKDVPEHIGKDYENLAKSIPMTSDDLDRGGYFKNLSKKDVIAHLIINRVSNWVYISKNDKAVKDIEKTILLNPDYPQLWAMISNEYLKIGNMENALKYIEQALKKSPQAFLFFNQRAVLYCRRSEFDKALSDLNEAIKLNPDYVGGYYERGYIFDKRNEYDKALIEVDKAVGVCPGDYKSHLARVKILYYRKKDYDKALEELKTVSHLRPKYARPYYIKGLIYRDTGDYKSAITAFEKCLNLEPNGQYAEPVKKYIEEIKPKIDEE